MHYFSSTSLVVTIVRGGRRGVTLRLYDTANKSVAAQPHDRNLFTFAKYVFFN